jgi:hypothetical protein
MSMKLPNAWVMTTIIVIVVAIFALVVGYTRKRPLTRDGILPPRGREHPENGQTEGNDDELHP